MRFPHIINVLLVSVVFVNIHACSQQDEDKNKAPLIRSVRTLTVGLPTDTNWREFPGVVAAAQQADLTFRVKGKLTKLIANEGDYVSRGQLVAQLDQTDYNIKFNSQAAEFDKASTDYKRGQDLVKKGVISRADFDKLKATYTTSKANLESAQQNLNYTKLKAPFSGRISKRHIENYEEVSSGNVIYTVQDISSFTVKVDVPESVMIRLREGANATIQAHFSEIPDTSFPLTLREVSTQADQDTKTFQVTFDMARVGKYNILPGMSVTVRGRPEVSVVSSDERFFVPAHTVLEDQKGRYVYIAEPQKDSFALVKRRDVRTGKLSSQGLKILSGLKEGDQVITAGMSKMRVDLQVRLTEGK